MSAGISVNGFETDISRGKIDDAKYMETFASWLSIPGMAASAAMQTLTLRTDCSHSILIFGTTTCHLISPWTSASFNIFPNPINVFHTGMKVDFPMARPDLK
jgi:hypothetical protein